MFKDLQLVTPPQKTPEELRMSHREWCSRFKPNCITSWFPVLVSLGIRVPRTEIVEFEDDYAWWAADPKDPENPIPYQDFHERVQAACDLIGYPCFLRSGQTSNKHDWRKSCFVTSSDQVAAHMMNIGFFSAMADIPATAFAAREMIPTKPVFHAFYGGMPVTREFRFFAEAGEITHTQPYWPPYAIQDPTSEEWQALLASINQITPEEYEYLAEMSKMISLHMEGEWSIDWLQDKDGNWWCTDMAWGGRSYRWNPDTGEEL